LKHCEISRSSIRQRKERNIIKQGLKEKTLKRKIPPKKHEETQTFIYSLDFRPIEEIRKKPTAQKKKEFDLI